MAKYTRNIRHLPRKFDFQILLSHSFPGIVAFCHHPALPKEGSTKTKGDGDKPLLKISANLFTFYVS